MSDQRYSIPASMSRHLFSLVVQLVLALWLASVQQAGPDAFEPVAEASCGAQEPSHAEAVLGALPQDAKACREVSW